MRLGAYCWTASSVDDLDRFCETWDDLGLSAIPAPPGYWNWTDEQCARFGERARALDLVIGEAGMWENFLDPDKQAVARRIETVRRMLTKGEVMGVRGVVTLVGSRDAAAGVLSPHPYNFSSGAKAEYRDVCLHIVDGLSLACTRYCTEPWCNSFYYDPDDIHAFLQSVGDPRVGLHLDMMNLVSQANYFQTTELINRTFDLLATHAVSVHAKDIRWDPRHLMLKLDEVFVGEGVLDYATFLHRLVALDPDMPVYTEHWGAEEEWRKAVTCLHNAAREAGLSFRRRRHGVGDLP